MTAILSPEQSVALGLGVNSATANTASSALLASTATTEAFAGAPVLSQIPSAAGHSAPPAMGQDVQSSSLVQAGHSPHTADQQKTGFALEGLQSLLPSEAVHPHEQEALKAALKQLESAKALFDGSPVAPLEIDTQTPTAHTQSNATQATAAISQNLATTPRPEAAASISAQAEQSANTASGLAEGLGAPNSTVEPANPFDVSIFSSDAPAARATDLTPLPALASLLVRKLETGGGQIAVRLDPPELGRLDITLGFDEDGAVTAHIRADRPEALELMQREAKGLEQSLRQAGFTVDSNALSFSLNQGNRGHGGDPAATPERYRKPNTGRNAQPESRVQHLEIHLQSNRALDVRV